MKCKTCQWGIPVFGNTNCDTCLIALMKQEKKVNEDNINHPPHYTHGKYECKDVITDWKLGYHLSTALAYICRAPHKGRQEEDIKKAIWYLENEVDRLEGN